jgi:hypothetical protein
MAISSVILSFAIYDNEVYSALQKQKSHLLARQVDLIGFTPLCPSKENPFMRTSEFPLYIFRFAPLLLWHKVSSSGT